MPIFDKGSSTWISYEGGDDVPSAFAFLSGWTMANTGESDPDNPVDTVTGGGPSKMELVKKMQDQIKGRQLTFAESWYLLTGNTTPKSEKFAHRLLPGGLDNVLRFVPAHDIPLDEHFVILLDEDGTNAVSARVLFDLADKCKLWRWRLFYEIQYRFGYYILSAVVGAILAFALTAVSGMFV